MLRLSLAPAKLSAKPLPAFPSACEHVAHGFERSGSRRAAAAAQGCVLDKGAVNPPLAGAPSPEPCEPLEVRWLTQQSAAGGAVQSQAAQGLEQRALELALKEGEVLKTGSELRILDPHAGNTGAGAPGTATG